jgi:type III secretion protein Q
VTATGAPREQGPRVDGADGAASWLATRLLARLPRRLVADVAELGAVELTLEGPAPRDGASPEHVAFGLGRAHVEGRLELDAGLAHRIVSVALGGAVDASVARLGFGARGVVAGVVAGALHALAAPVTIALAAPERAAVRAAGAVGLAVRVAVAGVVGWARLDVPAGWLADAARVPADGAALAALAVDAAVELARTTLAAGELAELRPGDAVVFDGARALERRGAEDWPARVVVGAYAAEARIAADATVSVEREFRRDPAAPDGAPWLEGIGMETRTRGTVVNAGDGAGEGTALLAAAPIEVVAELARVTLRGDELLRLGPGAVLRLDGTRVTAVALRVGGAIWAEGELVDVDGQLGVRVTSVSPPRAR